MKRNTAFIVYNYISASILIVLMLLFNIGVWPFTENIINKSYLPSNKAQKYVTVSTILLGELLAFSFIVYVLISQHKKIDILFTNV